MNVPNVAGYTDAAAVATAQVKPKVTASPDVTKEASEEKSTDTAVKQDSFVKSNTTETETGIYSKASITKALESAEAQRAQSFSALLQKMLGEQGKNAKLASIDLNSAIRSVYTQEDIDAAAASVAEGGEWSVSAVAGRIMDMAMSLAGDDPTKISALRDAVCEGFGAAVDSFGLSSMDDMPDITNQTYKEVMKRFDDWEKSYETDATDTE